MAKAKSSANILDLSTKERVAIFEAGIKEIIEKTKIGMRVGLVGPWGGSPEIKAVLSYVDLLAAEAKKKNEEQGAK